MNKQMVSELLSKVMVANESGSQYYFRFDVDDTSFRVKVFTRNTPNHLKASYTLAEYEPFLQDDPKAEEKALNYAIAELNYFIKYPELKSGIRLAMCVDMIKECRKASKDAGWVAEYFNLDTEVVEGAVNGLTA